MFAEQAKALPVGAMVRDIAMGVAQAQAEMDRSAVGLLREFAKKNIDLYGDGTKQVSLLELGFSPQFLYFQKVMIKVRMDLRFHVEEQSSMNIGASLNVGHESTTNPSAQTPTNPQPAAQTPTNPQPAAPQPSQA
ncbi:MAG: hypothetical protein KDK70_23270 [Myxococcales bacterium]|nr:hypothetical protein [Myxococcales bacterium]